jgi:hypothetical protein
LSSKEETIRRIIIIHNAGDRVTKTEKEAREKSEKQKIFLSDIS